MDNPHWTLNGESEYALSQNKSKFIAFLFPCSNEESFKEKLQSIQALHPKATHHCYSFRFLNPNQERANDDGEPSGSAGLPILGQLKSFKLFNCACVVVRYYGGTKLGVPGLISAYKLATKEAIELNHIIAIKERQTFQIGGEYAELMRFLSICSNMKWEAFLDDQSGEYRVVLNIEKKESQQVKNKLLLFSGLTHNS